jgi:REP element-mobilizing transposase RayT
MGRALRIIDPDSIYHVIPVGSDKRKIVLDDRDSDSLTADFSRAAARYEWEVLGWCVMPTHYHAIVRTPKDGFSPGFQLANGNHSRRTNRRYGGTAHLFKNRPFAIEIGSDAHLTAAILYAVRNPVAAGLCAHASHWKYSSYRATVGLVEAPPWLNVDALRELFGGPDEFERLVHNGHLPVSDTDGRR